MDCNLLIIAAPDRHAVRRSWNCKKLTSISREGGRLLLLFNYASIKRPTGLEPILQRWGVNVLADIVKDPKNTITGQDVDRPQVRPASGGESADATFAPDGPAAARRQSGLAESAGQRAAGGRNWRSPAPNATLASDRAQPPRSYPLIGRRRTEARAPASPTRAATRASSWRAIRFSSATITSKAAATAISRARGQLAAGPAAVARRHRPAARHRIPPAADASQQQQQLRWLLLGALPGGVLFFGWLVWLVRRK